MRSLPATPPRGPPTRGSGDPRRYRRRIETKNMRRSPTIVVPASGGAGHLSGRTASAGLPRPLMSCPARWTQRRAGHGELAATTAARGPGAPSRGCPRAPDGPQYDARRASRRRGPRAAYWPPGCADGRRVGLLEAGPDSTRKGAGPRTCLPLAFPHSWETDVLAGDRAVGALRPRGSAETVVLAAGAYGSPASSFAAGSDRSAGCRWARVSATTSVSTSPT